MEYSADPRLTDTELTELSEVFVKIYENGAYDPEEGNKTPAQRKQVKFQFKKTLANDLKKMSKYYYCIFRTVLEADISKLSLLRSRIREVKREKEQLVKHLEHQRQTMKNDVYIEIRRELEQGYFKEQAEQNIRLKKRVNEYNERIQYLNKLNDELKMDSVNFVSREEFDKLQEEYYNLKKMKDKTITEEQSKEEKEKEKKRAAIEKKRKELEELEASM
jgi:hypothetical protein